MVAMLSLRDLSLSGAGVAYGFGGLLVVCRCISPCGYACSFGFHP